MTSPRATVLIVDDEPALRELLTDALSDEYIQVSAAGSGEEALAMASIQKPDLVVTDLCLSDCNGLDVIDRLRILSADLPAVVITGMGDVATLAEASRRRPIEMLNKPLDIERLRQTVRTELSRQQHVEQNHKRTRRLRSLARQANIQRKSAAKGNGTASEHLTEACRVMSRQLASQRTLGEYQQQLIAAKSDDDAFRALFTLLVNESGALSGMAMSCDSDAELQMVGRFGVPKPDSADFCKLLARPIISQVLVEPRVCRIDAEDRLDEFHPSIRKFMVGVNILAMPLLPSDGELIGLVVLYRKGEQPFTDEDYELAKQVCPATALAIRRND